MRTNAPSIVVRDDSAVMLASFGLNRMSTEDALECIETFGKHVIPEYDRDPVHRTDHMRAKAVPKFGPFEHEPPVIETIHTRAAPGARP